MDLSFITNIFGSVSVDWLVIGALVVFVALDAMRSGTGRAAALIFSLPATLLVWNILPSAFFIGPFITTLPSWGPLVLFIVLAILMYVLCRQIIGEFSSFGNGPIPALLTGVATVIILLIVWLQMPQLKNIWDFGASIDALFAGQWSFWWLIGSLGILSFVRQS